ncbi:MAG: insulinase family protein [Candidatus Tenebribacter burtonii]|nr:insulinase family protein [Candidatus Tenebribacter burtonii]
MKRIIILVIMVIAIGTISANEMLQTTLTNGMQIVVKENRLNESVGFYCFVKTGSVNEGKYLGAGISHFLEHVVSGGTTEHHTEDEYNEMGKEMGSLVNAYTSSAVTAFHITVDKLYKDMALSNLSEQMQFCLCDSFQVAREREVILKEIVMRSTPPQSKVYQRSNELVYPNSNKHYPVIGYTELYKTISRDELQDYYKARYAPNNMIFVAVGNFEAVEMLEDIVETFKDFPRRQLEPVYQPVQHQREGSIEYIEEFEIESPSVYISTILSSKDYSDITTLNAAFEILFSKRQSPIRYELVEELQLVNSRGFYAYVSGAPNSPEGEITIQFEPKNSADIDLIISIIDEEIEKYSQSGITENDLQNFINRMKANKLLRTPGVSSDANSIGWIMMMYNIPDYYPTQIRILESLKVEDLTFQLRKHLVPRNRVIFKAVPKGEKALLESKDIASIEKSEIEKVQIDDNLILLHKMNSEKPLINAVLHLPITTDYETKENVGSLSFMTNLMFRGSKKFTSLEISEWKEDHAISFDTQCSANGITIEFKCLKADYPKLEEMLFDAFKNPSFEDKELVLAKEEVNASYKRSKSRATTAHRDYINAILFTDSRAGLSSENKKDIILSLTKKDLQELHKTFFNAGKLIVTLFGDISKEEAKEMAKEIKKNLPDRKINAAKYFTEIPRHNGTFLNKYGFEQVNLDIYCPAPPLSTEDYDVMKLINNILSGSRGRLHQAVRGTNNLAYYAFPQYQNSENFGYFKLNSQTSIDKKDELIEVMVNELTKLMTEEVPTDELNSAIDENEKMLKAMVNENSLPYYITYFEALGLGYDYIDRVSEIFRKITPAQIKTVANKYFVDQAVIISEPDETVELMVE